MHRFLLIALLSIFSNILCTAQEFVVKAYPWAKQDIPHVNQFFVKVFEINSAGDSVYYASGNVYSGKDLHSVTGKGRSYKGEVFEDVLTAKNDFISTITREGIYEQWVLQRLAILKKSGPEIKSMPIP